MLLILLEVLAGLLLEDERPAGEGRRAVPGECRARRARRRHRQRVQVPVEEIPVAAVVTVIARAQLYLVQTQRIPLVRRRHLDCGCVFSSREGEKNRIGGYLTVFIVSFE